MELTPSPYEASKSFWFIASYPTHPARLDSFGQNLYNSKSCTQIFRYPELKLNDDFLSFSELWDTILHSLRIIGSARYLNFPSYLLMLFVNQCRSLLLFPLFSKFLPASSIICTSHDSISTTPQHTKSILNNYTMRVATSTTTFRTHSPTPSVNSFEIFGDCTRFLE